MHRESVWSAWLGERINVSFALAHGPLSLASSNERISSSHRSQIHWPRSRVIHSPHRSHDMQSSSGKRVFHASYPGSSLIPCAPRLPCLTRPRLPCRADARGAGPCPACRACPARRRPVQPHPATPRRACHAGPRAALTRVAWPCHACHARANPARPHQALPCRACRAAPGPCRREPGHADDATPASPGQS